LKFAEINNNNDQGKFVNVFAEAGRLVLTINNVPLTAGPTGNINSAEIWKFISVDIATKKAVDIQGTPVSTNAGGAYPVFTLDGKTILRVNAPSKSIAGYYELKGNVATELFAVKGGNPSGFTKIKIRK